MLDEWTLVLNRSWIPIDVTTVLRATCKLYQGTALAVDTDDYSMHDFESWVDREPASGSVLRTATFSFPIPEVIVLLRFNKVPRRSVSFSRWNLFKRDGFTCQYCGSKPRREQLTIDHVVPRSRGGLSRWDNCVVACQGCNAKKGSRSPKEVGLHLARPPKKPQWSPTLIVGEDSLKPSWERFVS